MHGAQCTDRRGRDGGGGDHMGGRETNMVEKELTAESADTAVALKCADDLSPMRWPPIAKILSRAVTAARIGFSDLKAGVANVWTGDLSIDRAQRTASSAGSMPSTRLATSS